MIKIELLIHFKLSFFLSYIIICLLFYEKNINKYLTSKYFDVVQYSSTNRNALVDTIQNPSKVTSGEVTKVPLKLERLAYSETLCKKA